MATVLLFSDAVTSAYKDTSKAERNFETIFNTKYDEYYITAKSLTNLIVSLIYTH